jgi:RNA polymerase sigma-70 factor (ECF subfamily)
MDLQSSEDAVQGFFEKLLRTESWRNLDVAKGRLRSFLLQSMRYYLANVAESENAQKRGGGMVFAMDFSEVEPEVQLYLEDRASPDVLFDRSWVSAVLGRVLGLLRAEAEGRGRGESFEALAPLIPDKGTRGGGYADVASMLRITESDVRLRLFRLRKRYRELLRLEIGQTVATPEEVDGEIAELFQIFAGP